MEITFLSTEAWDPSRDVVIFPAKVDGVRVSCAISIEALQDNFYGSRNDPLATFIKNRSRIEEKAKTLIRARRHQPDGSILIRTSDGS